MQRIFVMSGMPGIGKSTWAKRFMEISEAEIDYISRDEIRFELVPIEDEYFSKENIVFANFIHEVNKSIAAGHDVIVDATHLNRASRNKLLRNLAFNRSKVSLILVLMPFNLNLAIERNELRKGTRSYVPEAVIRRMARSIDKPTAAEGFNEIWHVNNYGNVKFKEVLK